MAIFLYPSYTLAHIILLMWGISIYAHNHRIGTLLTLLVTAGLIYDNLIISLGNWLREGTLLEILSYLRFWLHQLLLPWVVIVGIDQLRASGNPGANKRWVMPAGFFFTIVVILLGLGTRVRGLELSPTEIDGVLRYIAVKTSGPPLSSFLSVGFLGFTGFLLWRQSAWPWLFLTVLLVFIGEGAVPNAALRMVIGSGVEVLLILVLLLTDNFLYNRVEENRSETSMSNSTELQKT